MKITLLARADNTGLGTQTWEFYRHMKPHKTYVLDLNSINAAMGKSTELHLERFPAASVIEGFPDEQMCRKILEDTDVLFTIETAYNYRLFELAKEMGVKTVLQYNYEFLDYLQLPNLPMADLLLAPSEWHLADLKQRYANVRHLPVPTNRKVLPFYQRQSASHFLHIAGHATYGDRNGTLIVVEAMKHVKSRKAKLTIYAQSNLAANERAVLADDPRVEICQMDVKEYWQIYDKQFDVLLLPRRYGGLSLQLNEAMSVGMPVIMSDTSPQNGFLPKQCLVAAAEGQTLITRTNIETYNVRPEDLAAKMDEFVRNPKQVKALSRIADMIASQQSWDALKPQYLEVLQSLCRVTP